MFPEILHGLPVSRTPPLPPTKSVKRVLGAIALVCVLFAAGLGAFVYYMVSPRGERVGALSLRDPNAVLLVDSKPGDVLLSRVDARIGVPPLALPSDDQIEQRASQQLRSSRLTVHATAPSGKERSSSCPVYKGRATSTTTTPSELSRAGMLNDCSLFLDEAGAWQIRAAVAWTSDLQLRDASLELRRESVAP